MNTQNYLRYASPINVQKMLPITEDILTLVAEHNKKEHFLSVYQYNEDQFKQYKNTNTASGMTGMKTNMLVFDFDSKVDVQLALNDAKEMFTRLLAAGLKERDIQIYYSGSKGSHIVVNLNQFLDKKQVLNIVRNLGKDLNTLDLQIYDEARLFRCPLSYHAKSKLYKIPLSKETLFTLTAEEIKRSATEQDIHVDQLNAWNYSVALPNHLLQHEEIEAIVHHKERDEDLPGLEDDKPDFSQKTKELTESKYALQMGFFEDGERNEAFTILTATYKYLGYPKEFSHRMLKATDELYVARMAKKGITKEPKPKNAIWNEHIKHVYGPMYKGGTYSEKDSELLIKTIERYNIKPKDEVNPLVETEALGTIFKKFATEIDKNTIKLGFGEIDNDIQITTSMLVYLLAAPSAGKSSISFSILNHASRNNLNTMFFSLDMGAPLVYQRLMQKHTGMQSKNIFKLYQENSKSVAEFEKTVSNNYKNVKFCFRSGLTVDDIEKYIEHEKNNSGEYPKLIVLDYLECIAGPYSDATANSGYIANRLKDVANKYECTVLLLVQPQKHTGDPSAELLSMRNVKGSSILEQAASIILTLSRPGFNPKNPENDKYAMISVVKNRMGQLKTWDFSWNGLTGQIGSLLDEERAELAEMRSKKAAEKETKEWL